MISLAGGLPAPELFPTGALAEAAALTLARGEGLQYGLSEGSLDLRQRLVRLAELTQAGDPGHQATPGPGPDRLVVTTGSQQGLDLVARVCVAPGTPVVVGDPCYVGARQALASQGAELVGVPVDADGLDVDHLARLVDDGLRPRLVYVVPNFDNPTGTVLSPERRARLVRLAEAHHFLIVEDDPYGRLRFEGAPVQPIGEGSPWVVRLRTVSKTLAPGLRIGWLEADPEMVEAVTLAKQAVDLHTSALGQAVVANLLAQPGWYQAHLATLGPHYRARRDALVAAVDRWLPGAHYTVPGGGMFLWLHLPGVDTDAALPRALDRGVAYVPGSAFAVSRPLGDHLRLSFATATPAQLDTALARLAPVLEPIR